MCDNARKRIKIKIKKKEKTQEPVLQCADIFRVRPTHLGPTPCKKTRKSAVYQLARTCTQERPGQSAKIIANADDICSRKQANEITEGLGTFQKCFLVKKDKQFLLLMKGHAVTLQILFLRGIFDDGKWKNIFQSYFLDTWRS